MTINTQRRYAVYAGVAAVAGLTGVGVAWQRHRMAELSDAALARLWASEFNTPTGELLKLSGFQGQGMVVNFWATWCPPCVEEMPLLDRFYRENSSKGWQVIGLAIDQPSQVKRFLNQFPVAYPIALGGLQGSDWVRQLGNAQGGLPFTVVFDGTGKLKSQKLGKLSSEDLQAWL